MLLALLGALVLFKALTLEREGGERIGSMPLRPTCLHHRVGAALRLRAAAPGPVRQRCRCWSSSPASPVIEFKLREVLINIVVLTVGSWLIFIKGLNLVIPLWPVFLAG